MEAVSAYDVFINHRGPDVKNTLASLIYHRLKNSGLRVFLDRNELQAGDPLSPAITSAISSAFVHIAIFSQRYAESSWCLDELLQMLETHAKIVPIFYGVQPWHLRHIEKGPYAQAFFNHESKSRFEIQLLERWKDALSRVSNISGLVHDIEKDDLGELLEKVVEVVIKEVRRVQLVEVAEHPVGLDKAAEDFQNHLLKQRKSKGVMSVGIVGLGGSGKSTLVRHFYNLKRSEFRRSCFLSDVSKTDLLSLQRTLLYDLMGYEIPCISDTYRGKIELLQRLEGLPLVLIVIDGLDNSGQIESLLLVKRVLGEGSLILVTAVDRELLLSGKWADLLYDVKLLDRKDAKELFCRHAFGQSEPLKSFEFLAEEFVKICDGFPLALKVLGGQLSVNHDLAYWRWYLEILHKGELPVDIVEKILKVTYNSLNNKEKEILLDVAHFLVGEDKVLAVRVLQGLDGSDNDCLYEKWLDTLHKKCLLDFEDEMEHRRRLFSKGLGYQWRPEQSYRIRMHDLVRDMARQTARDESPLRLCLDDKTMRQPSTPCLVRGIRWDNNGLLPLPFWFKDDRIRGLKILMIRGFTDPFPFEGLLGDLVWLRLTNVDCRRISSGLSLPSLRVLELSGVDYSTPSMERSESFSHRSDMSVPNTSKASNLLPFDKISPASNLLPFDESSPASNLLPFDKSSPARNLLPFDKTTSLTRFSSILAFVESFPASNLLPFDKSSPASNLLPFEKSSPVPGDFVGWLRMLNIGEMKNLVKLVLKNIFGFHTTLPFDFKELRNLRHLDLSGCKDLEVLPDSFTALEELRYLALQGCRKLRISELGKISKLEYLDFEGCSSLWQLPEGSTNQRNLKYLNLVHTNLNCLPEQAGELKHLEQLSIGSPYLRSLPFSLNNLACLKDLCLVECSCLSDISLVTGMLQSLQRLRICESAVKTLPEASAWPNIEVVDIEKCCIQNFSFKMLHVHHIRLSSLTNLSIKYTSISKFDIPEAENLCPNLEIVDLSYNSNLEEVEGLPRKLIRLELRNCVKLRTLACISNLEHLRALNVSGCSGLQILNVSGCYGLKILNVNWCCGIKGLNVESLGSIEEIQADGCWELQSIQGLQQLQNLNFFCISSGNDAPNSFWSEITPFPSNISTAILSRVTLDVHIEKMDQIVRQVLRRFQQVKLIGILPVKYPFESRIRLKLLRLGNVNMEGAILLCFIGYQDDQFLIELQGVERHSYETYPLDGGCESNKTCRVFIFMCTKDSKMLTIESKMCKHRNLVVKCTVKPYRNVKSLRKGWIVRAENEEDGVILCEELLRSLVSG